MKKNINRAFGFFGYIVQHKEQIGANSILYCMNNSREYAEIVIEKAAYCEGEELLWNNKIMCVESVAVDQKNWKKYIVVYQGTLKTTVIYAESMKLYQSTHFIYETGRYAVEEWNKRHICLPSLLTAILMLETDGGKNLSTEIREMLKELTDYYAACKVKSMAEESFRLLWDQKHYISAVQQLQQAVPAYKGQQEFETLLIQKIEENRLMRFDP